MRYAHCKQKNIMDKVKVSIIVPTYNVEQYIIPCLQSVSQQTLKNIECLVVNDCGDDTSISKAQKFIEEYEGNISFRIIHREKNGGLSAARNSGLREAIGEYIYFLDSDDLLCPSSIECLLNVIGSSDMCVGSYESFVDGNVKQQFKNRTLLTDKYIGRENVIKSYVHGFWPVMAWNKLVRHSFIKENNLYFDEGLIHEDEMWTFNVLKFIRSITTSASVTYKYRQRPGSIMTVENPKNRLDLARILNAVITYTAKSEDNSLYDYCQYMYHFVSVSVFSNKVSFRDNKLYYSLISNLPIKMKGYGFFGKIMSLNINNRTFVGFCICYLLAGLRKRNIIKI